MYQNINVFPWDPCIDSGAWYFILLSTGVYTSKQVQDEIAINSHHYRGQLKAKNDERMV